MANQIKNNKTKPLKVKWASSTEVDKIQSFLKELEGVIETKHLWVSDEITFSIYCDISFSNSRLNNQYKEFMKLKIENAFGCSLPDAIFNKPIKEACDYLIENRTNSPAKKDSSVFLGIRFIKEIQTQDCYKLSYPFFLKDHVDYFSGWIMGKVNPLNGPEEMKKNILKDFEQMKDSVYGTPNTPRWEIKTEEGDILRFFNLHEVNCWLIARSSNYKPDAMTKENW